MASVMVTEPALLIRIAKLYNAQMSTDELYEATRGVWKVGENRNTVELAFAVAEGVVRDVYAIRQWHPAGTTPYATRAKKNVEAVGRWEFTGGLASEKLRTKYLGKSVSHYFKRGNTNPVFYVNAKAET